MRFFFFLQLTSIEFVGRNNDKDNFGFREELQFCHSEDGDYQVKM